MKQPTQRTLERCRALGWPAAVVERWNPHARVRLDVFGFGDVLAIRPDCYPILIQTTTASHVSARAKKIAELCNDAARAWLGVDCAIEIWGWRKSVKERRWICLVYSVIESCDALYLVPPGGGPKRILAE